MHNSFQRLFAKSGRKNELVHPSMYLIGHLMDVHAAARQILDTTGQDQLCALGLDPVHYMTRFRQCVLLAAAVHDIGKANDHFQGMLYGYRNIRINPQGMRHEWVTVLMLQTLRTWLLPAVANSESDFAVVEWAVAGHHPALHHECPPVDCPSGAGVDIQFLLGHDDTAAILNWWQELFELDPPKKPAYTNSLRTLGESNHVFAEANRLWRSARQRWAEMMHTDDRKLVAAVKNCLVAADIAGSALPKAKPDDTDRWNWITRAFANRPRPGDLEKIYRHRLGGKQPRLFQQRVADSAESVTFVKAGCGTGKTVAAYMWAAKHHPTRRLYICYPTTGTATEGFKDYLYEPDGELEDIGAKLFHSRRDIDFDVILGNGNDSEEAAHREEIAKLESLEAWSTPIVSCTVDTVLGIVQNNRRGLFAWPALAQSAFVFDEIHSYDDRLFGAMVRFLCDLPGIPVLLMTASLPKPREDALRTAVRKRNIELNPIDGPEDLEKLPRYHRMKLRTNDPLPLVADELAAGGKVLWVCNTVGRAMDAAERTENAGLTNLIYHSRFIYVDRVERHKDVVEAFTPEYAGSALAICTQVAEMSLDLKGCTMLVTDLAPIAAMIQRLGRLNRQAQPGDTTRPFIIVEPNGARPYLPYSSKDLVSTRAWLEKLPETNISQRDLIDRWEQTSDQPPERVSSAWLDGGPITTVTELRETSPGITVLMREDVEKINDTKGKSGEIARYLLPMPNPPHGMIWQHWLKHKGIPIVEPGFIDYNRKRGGKWQVNPNPQPLIL